MKFNKIVEISALFDSTIFGLVVLDSDYNFLLVNDSAKEMLNYSNANNSKIAAYFANKSSEKLQKTLLDINLATKQQSVFLETKHTNKYIECEVSCCRFEEELVYILFLKDVSQKMEMQKIIENQSQEQKETHTELEKEQELSDLKSRFIAIASHEFKTPLTGILSSLKLLERYIKQDEELWQKHPFSDKIDSHIYKIGASIESLNQILDQFLSLSRLQNGDSEYHIEEVNVRSLAFDIIQQLNAMTKKDQVVYLNYSGDEQLKIDRMMLRIILSNIISNSIKYSPENAPIQVNINKTPDYLQMEIIDQGIGIPVSEQKEVFKRFYRASNAENIQGTGLGLHIIKKYIELLQGNISFESKENEGTKFTILIPVTNDK